MFKDSIQSINEMARVKKNLLDKSLFQYLLLSALAGAYVGLGVVLAISVGAPFADSSLPVTSLIMGLSFAVALVLVIFAGAELFTGNHMIFTVSTLSKVTGWKDVCKNWFWCFIGNFIGAIILCLLIVGTGIFKSISPDHLLMTIAVKKMSMDSSELFFRAILCNWLVCLAIWTTLRTKSDTAKIMLIFWMLFTFVSSGYEHSVANMTFLGLALMHPHSEAISLTGFFHNLAPVTLGNIIGGGLFLGTIYWFVETRQYKQKPKVTKGNASINLQKTGSSKY